MLVMYTAPTIRSGLPQIPQNIKCGGSEIPKQVMIFSLRVEILLI